MFSLLIFKLNTPACGDAFYRMPRRPKLCAGLRESGCVSDPVPPNHGVGRPPPQVPHRRCCKGDPPVDRMRLVGQHEALNQAARPAPARHPMATSSPEAQHSTVTETCSTPQLPPHTHPHTQGRRQSSTRAPHTKTKTRPRNRRRCIRACLILAVGLHTAHCTLHITGVPLFSVTFPPFQSSSARPVPSSSSSSLSYLHTLIDES